MRYYTPREKRFQSVFKYASSAPIGEPARSRFAISAAQLSFARTDLGRSVLKQIEEHVSGDEPSRNVMVWLGAGMDAADGQLTLRRPLLAPWTGALDLRWKPEQSQAVVDAILAVHRSMTEATGGSLRPNAVVNHLGKVFGYPNLYVVDGAILPAIGRNPSHTIAALAERVAAHVN